MALPKKFRKAKMEVIEWVDACGQQGWNDLSAVEPRVLTCITIGFVFKESKKFVTLVDAIQVNGHQVGNLTSIPRGMITRRTAIYGRRKGRSKN